METSLQKFKENLEIINKDFSQYKTDNELLLFNTIKLFENVIKLELESNEYQYALSKKEITKDNYTIKKIKKVVPKSTITGKKEDQLTLVDKEVDVRIIYKRVNGLGYFDCYTEAPIEDTDKFNKELFEKIK